MIADRVILIALLLWGAVWAAPARAQTGTNAFAARPMLTLSGGVATGSSNNGAASAEANEPAHLGDPAVRSVWWRWTAPATGLAQIDTVGTPINSRLAVYTGAQLASLQLVAANLGSDDADNFESVVRFQAVSGTAYSICVDGYTDPDTGETETGAITLTVRQPGPGTRPTNDLFASATVLAGTASVAASGTIMDASVEAEEPDPEAAFVSLGPARTVWYSWTAPSSGFFTLRIEADEVTPWEPAAAVYTGSLLGGLTLVDKAEVTSFAPGDFDLGLLSATFSAVGGQTYRIQVGGLAFLTSSGPFELSLNPAVRPLGDDFGEAVDVGAAIVYAGGGSLLEATQQPGEPNHFASIGGTTSISSASIWWKWTSPAAGPVTVDTRGSDGDTILAVYRAGAAPPTVANLILEAANDDINFDWGAFGSAVSFNSVAGRVYYIAVTGYSQSSRVAFHLATGGRRNPYEAWLIGHPGLTGAAAARGADPDADGLTNLQELLHGTDPLVPSHAAEDDRFLLPALIIEGANLVLECGHDNESIVGLSDGSGAGGVPLAVEAQQSFDLDSWIEVPAGDVGLGTSFAFATVPLGAEARQWLRFRISDPNP